MQPTVSPHCPKCGAELASAGAECANCLLELGFASIVSNQADPASENTSAARVFGDYELLDEIARGGMGVVYRARQRRLGRTVALKLILGGQLATREFVHRFRAEAAAAAALQHPNIVAIHDVGVHDGNHFFSMDYVQGQNLAQLVGHRPLPAQKAAHYVKLIAEAIHYAHEQGILHRDLKPSNVLVDAATDQPRVTDFGLAKWLDGESSLTLTGQVLGSPHFMPPEQADARRGKLGRRSDVYALGGILYFLLTARPPFQGDSLEATLGQVLNVEPVSPRLLNPTVPRDLETICLKCLNKEPDRRYPTAHAIGEDLSRFLNAESILARPATMLERTWRWCRRKPAVAGLVAAAVVLLLTLAIGSSLAAFRIQRALQSAEASLYGADLNMVQTALADADLVHARGLLDRHRPAPGQSDPRGFEWRYLWNLCQGDEKFVFEPVIKWPRRVVFSQDGRLLAAGEVSGNLSVVWNVATKAVVKTLPQGDRPVTFARDGPGLLTAGRNGLKLWNTQTWKERVLGQCHTNATAVFSPDGSWLIVYGAGLQVWDTQNYTLVSSNDFGEINWWVTATLSVSRDGTRISCGQGFPYATAVKMRLFRLPSLEPVPWSERLPKDVAAAAFHPERDLLVTGGWSGDIRLWNSNSGQELPSIMKQTPAIYAMSFNPADPDQLATTGLDRTIHLWDLASQKERTRLHGASEELQELAFSPLDGQTIATGGAGDPITLWNAAQTKANIITAPTETRNCVLGYSENGKQLVTIDATGQVIYRDPTSLAVLDAGCRVDMESALESPPMVDFIALAMASSPGIKMLALGRRDGTVEIWNLETRTKRLLSAHSKPVCGLAFSPDSNQLITVGNDHEVHLWNLATLSQVASAPSDEDPDPNYGASVRFSPSGDLVAVGSKHQLSIFRGTNLHGLHHFGNLKAFESLRFSPDGRYLVSGHDGGGLIVWDTHDWSNRSLPGHEFFIADIAFSPDGHRLVSGGEKLIVWDTDRWHQLASYKQPIQDINHITFSPDGNDLITSDPNALRVWRAPSFKAIADREARLGRWR